MRYYFYNSNEGIRFSWAHYEWLSIMRLAKAFGWIPEGTDVSPWFTEEDLKEINARIPDYKWNYTDQDNQLITATDATNIAKALKKGLDNFYKHGIDLDIVVNNPDIAKDIADTEKRAGQRAEHAGEHIKILSKLLTIKAEKVNTKEKYNEINDLHSLDFAINMHKLRIQPSDNRFYGFPPDCMQEFIDFCASGAIYMSVRN